MDTTLSRKKNSAARNYDFKRKKTAYFTKNGVSSFALTTLVLEQDKWTVDVMQARQDRMLAAFDSHWRLQERQSEAQATEALLAELRRPDVRPVFELEGKRHGLTATAQERGAMFRVLAGSMARQEWLGPEHSYKPLRQELINRGALQANDPGSALLFKEDVDFASPSAASAVVLGRADNGRLSWRIKGTSITYAAWQASNGLFPTTLGGSEGQA